MVQYIDKDAMVLYQDWLNSHHFDYRNLIEKGFAIAVTENNNPYEEGYWSEDLFICDFDDVDKWELVEQKPTWSEEDERSIRDSVFYLKSAKKYFEKDNDILWDEKWFNLCIEWLESLKDRIKG